MGRWAEGVDLKGGGVGGLLQVRQGESKDVYVVIQCLVVKRSVSSSEGRVDNLGVLLQYCCKVVEYA